MILLDLGLTLFNITKDTVFAEIVVSSNIFGFLVVDWTPKWIKSANLGCVQFKPKHKSLKNFQTMCFSYWRLPVVEIATKSNNIWGCKSSKKPQMGHRCWIHTKNFDNFWFHNHIWYNGLSQKKIKQWVWRHSVLKTPLGFFGFLIYPWKLQEKQGFTPRNSTKLCYTPQK